MRWRRRVRLAEMPGAPTFRLDPPRLRTVTDPDEERHATWFELYFDLVFVVAVGELAAALARDPSAADFARFAGLFVVVAWAWAGFTFYANRFDTDDLIYRLAKSGAMLAIAAIAINVHLVMRGHGGTVGFALGYVVVRSLLVFLYFRARLHVRGQGRTLIDMYIAGFSFTTGALAPLGLRAGAVSGPALGDLRSQSTSRSRPEPGRPSPALRSSSRT